MNDLDSAAKADVLRQSSKTLRRDAATVVEAYSAINAVAESEFANLTDIFDAGYCSLRAGLFQEAVKHLSQLISRPYEDGYDYYISQALFWRSYAFFKLREFDRAEVDILSIIDETAPLYVSSLLPTPERLAFTAQEFADLIKAAKSGSTA